MGQYDDVHQFIAKANAITEVNELGRLLEDVGKTLGFDYFALVHHHINLIDATQDTIHVFNYPEAWVGTIIEQGYFRDDPMLAASEKSGIGFLWTDIGKIIALNSRHREILRAAGQNGMGDGFTIPANVPGEFHGSCSFGTRFGRTVDPRVVPIAHYIGCFAFEAARTLLRTRAAQNSKSPLVGAVPELTQRQLDCLVLAARGKSDHDIGKLLGISWQTVHKHMEHAKSRYNVSSRRELILRTLYDCKLTYATLYPG
jgi:LuxR family quorum-sensing system transcriptional regulator CciR